MFPLIFIACIEACHAGLLSLSPEDFQQPGDIKIASIVHNTPTAVSHTTFTRVHNHRPDHSQQTQAAQTTTVGKIAQAAAPAVAGKPIYTTQQLHAIPAKIVKPELATVQMVNNIGLTAAAVKGETPLAESQRHTPAHLTFAARPVVYQMLPEIKPVRKISFDEYVPSPRKVEYVH